MKKLILKGFEVQLIMIFFSLMIFATNEFTLSHTWINAIASTLLIFVYLLLLYVDSFKIASEYIGLEQKPPLPFAANAVVYIIPVLLLIWSSVAPLEFKEAYIIDPGDLENGIPAVVDYVTAVRQNAWFELYMFPYKGIYTMFGSGLLCHVLTFLPGFAASFFGYFNAKRGVDLLDKANRGLQKLIYRNNKEN